MQFFGNSVNGNYLRNVLPPKNVNVERVWAAIAYGNDDSTLLKDCLERNLRLDIWMRYDETVPVSPILLQKLLNSVKDNIFCYLIPDYLHAKVIWWKGYGVYIGSANLTQRAWNNNIEFGVFLEEESLFETGEIEKIDSFFQEISGCERSFALTQEIVDEQQKQLDGRQSIQRRLEEESIRRRSIPLWDGPNFKSQKNSQEKSKENFLREWGQTLSYLRNISHEIVKYRPKWLNESVPAAWQADQFLHAYYYGEVVDEKSHPYENFYLKNKSNPKAALNSAMEWWASLPSPILNEDYNCHERAPVIRRLLSKGNIENLSEKEFIEVCKANHSTSDHAKRIRHNVLGVLKETSQEERVEAFAKWLWVKKNFFGESVIELIQYVLDGGPPEKISGRIYEVARDSNKRIERLGINQIAELSGWARPDICPPRNGRTSKALRALGYSVAVY